MKLLFPNATLALALGLFLSAPALATPWLGMPGATELSLAYETSQYDDMLSPDGVVEKGWGVTSQAMFFGLGHDLAETVKISIVTGYGQSSSTKPGGKTEGLLDTDLKVGLNLVDPFETSGFGLGLQIGYRVPGTYEIAKVPHGIGKRVQAASAELLAAYAIETVTLQSSIGFRFSADPAPHDIFGQSSLAWNPVEDASVELHYTYQFGQSGGDLGPDVVDLVTMKEDDQTLHALVGYQLSNNFGLGLRYAKALAGRNAPDATRFGLSLNYRL